MSRTVRRKNVPLPSWMKTDIVNIRNPLGYIVGWIIVPLKENDPLLKKYELDFRRDSDKYKKRSIWPGWAITEYIQRPYRRASRIELNRYIRDSLHEVIIPSKPKKGWWD